MVRSVDVDYFGKETFEVLYSKTDNNPDSFMRVTDIDNEAPGQWTRITARIPEGSKYFAIRSTSVGRFILMVDNIEYTAEDLSKLELLGYNVYSDCRKVNEEPLAETSYKVTEGGRHSYAVSAVYAQGESAPCKALELNGLETVNGIATFSVQTLPGAVSIVNPTSQPVTVYTAQGIALAVVGAGESRFIQLPAGMYVAAGAGRSVKLFINN